MQNRYWGALFIALAASWSAGEAQAQERVEVYENTARVVEQGHVRLGLFSADLGVTRRVSAGVDVPAWVTRAFSNVLAPNLHVKAALAELGPIALTARVGGYFITLNGDNAEGQIVLLPLSLLASVEVLPDLWIHGEGTYTWSHGYGSADIGRSEVAKGTVGLRSAQAGLMLEWRLSPLVALLARGRYQFYETPLVVRGGGDPDPYTHVDLAAQSRPRTAHPWLATAAVALTWTHVGFIVGAGYGEYIVPGSNLVLPYEGLIPEAEFTLQF